MGTSKNVRSPSTLRWRAVRIAYEQTSRPRAVGQLFVAAQADGWGSALATNAVAQYAEYASLASTAMPGLLAEARTPGEAVRRLVDAARWASLDARDYAEAGLVPSIAERALTRTVVPRLQIRRSPIHARTCEAAATSWEKALPTPRDLAGDFLTEAIRAVTMHLVMRDGPQLVGGPIGGLTAVAAFADDMAVVATQAARPARDVLEATHVLKTWPFAIRTAWSAAREYAVKLEDGSGPADSGRGKRPR